MVDISIIIPSYNTADLLLGCLDSIFRETKIPLEVVVVDNSSTDQTVARVRQKYQGVKVIENKQNFGFARAINQGLSQAKGKFILLLNSDTVIINRAIEKMVSSFPDNCGVGVMGCCLKTPEGKIQPSGGYLPTLARIFFWMSFLDDLPLIKKIIKPYHLEDIKSYKGKQELGWVTGAFFLTKAEIVEKIGYFDEKMFMYVEEVDWCMRVKQQGLKVIYDSEASIIHYKGASTKRGKAGIFEEFQGLKYYFRKYKPFRQMPLLRLFLRLGALDRLIIFGIILKDLESKRIYARLAKTS
jgi:GT2 family glycosyltransferase